MSKAFTLIELLVVISIIVLMTALTLPNYRSGANQLGLQRSAHKIAQSLRMAQEYAISAKEFSGTVPAGYGTYFDLDQPTSFILFADLDGDQEYSGLNEKVEEISLEVNVVLNRLVPATPQSSLTIVFIPPDPTIVFYPDAPLSTITLEASGTRTTVSQYTYYSDFWNLNWWVNPRASCDTSSDTLNCPESFSAIESDPLHTYDWFKFLWIFNISKEFEKQESQVVSVLEKSIQVNKVGLIFVE